MTMLGVFHLNLSTARLYTSKKEGRGLPRIENVVRQEEQSLKSYASRKAESDSLTAECKLTLEVWILGV